MPTVTAEAFLQCIHDHHMYGLGELASQTTAHPLPQMRTWMWKWRLLDSIVRQSGEVTPVGEERRALRDRDGSPYEGIALEYTDAQTGGPCLPTIGCDIQLIRSGEDGVCSDAG